ncbi:hypothetical protein AOQ84DRAFT_431443 [Glonium stellatum]|uniref:Uncharacterized protein n=1 Tax=Glonium stellatum TaxID=574774 RepID=A0A8E2F376_9PEZI|nr:hypothetical protein AOQ84DRAFT_431443 [Glonium stellatum]
MAINPGKRKRVTREDLQKRSSSPESSQNSETEDIQAIFKRHFEAKFKPLDPEHKKTKIIKQVEEAQDEDRDSDWDGIISSEEAAVEVIEHSALRVVNERAEKDEIKAFMSSKPPSSGTGAFSKTTKPKPVDIDSDAEALNLKNDLALQRLLRESHLLDTSTSTSSLALSGTNRHKALDMRLQSLGSKASILTQEKMPMSHRKGIQAKALQREERRRREAKENGIILEAAIKMKGGERKRERGVGGPGVGKFKGGTLSLSKKDIESIQGRRGTKGKRGRR